MATKTLTTETQTFYRVEQQMGLKDPESWKPVMDSAFADVEEGNDGFVQFPNRDDAVYFIERNYRYGNVARIVTVKVTIVRSLES